MQTKIQKLIFVLLLISGIFIFLPYLDYQVHIAQGDHGRDLYAAEAVWRGELPYQNFWWVYGPIMPYLYGIFYKLFGVSVNSMLLGQTFFKLLAGIFIYWGLSWLIVPWGAAIGTLWFWSFYPDFFYTYNHTGGITLLMATTASLLAYIKSREPHYLYFGLIALFLLAFVKVNIGIFALTGFLFLVVVIHKANKVSLRSFLQFYVSSGILLPVSIFFMYALLLQGLPIYAIRQCLPYLAEDHPYNAPAIVALRNIYEITLANIASSPGSILLALLVLLALAQTVHKLLSEKTPLAERRDTALAIFALCVLYVVNFHEFLASGTVIYRAFWAKPFSILLMIFVLYYSIANLPRWINGALSLVLGVILVMGNFSQQRLINSVKEYPWQNLDMDRAHVFLSNEAAWIQTVRQATNSLQATVPPNETFLALPYDPLYYFLAGKPTPTRQLIFFEHINIPPQQEQSVIQEIEKHNVNYILQSNRSLVPSDGLGILGKTYCPTLGKYIEDNFEVIQSFGPWQRPNGDGWAWDHSVQILKRTNKRPH